MKICKIYENLRNTMRVLRGQEASLESSKGFYPIDYWPAIRTDEILTYITFTLSVS